MSCFIAVICPHFLCLAPPPFFLFHVAEISWCLKPSISLLFQLLLLRQLLFLSSSVFLFGFCCLLRPFYHGGSCYCQCALTEHIYLFVPTSSPLHLFSSFLCASSLLSPIIVLSDMPWQSLCSSLRSCLVAFPGCHRIFGLYFHFPSLESILLFVSVLWLFLLFLSLYSGSSLHHRHLRVWHFWFHLFSRKADILSEQSNDTKKW